MMSLVAFATVTLIVIAQHNAGAAMQRDLKEHFATRLAALMEDQKFRQASAATSCRALAESVRIRAALEDEPENFYDIAEGELGGALRTEGVEAEDGPPRASFFRFLDRAGRVLPGGNPDLPAVDRRIEEAALASDTQRTAYLALPVGKGVWQAIATPVIDPNRGERLGTLALFFDPADFLGRTDEPGAQSGLWVGGRLFMPTAKPADRTRLEAELRKATETGATQGSGIPVEIGGAPHSLFFRGFSIGSQRTSAKEVCVYPLAEVTARQRWLDWKIAAAGLAVLCGGLATAHFAAGRLSQPVAQLAADSDDARQRQEHAETALEITERKYRSIFENAIEGIFVLSPEGRCLSANPALARIFGCASPDELTDDPSIPQRLFERPEEFIALLDHAADAGLAVDWQSRVRRKDGQNIWISQSLRAIRDSAGEVLRFEGALEDITARRRAADELESVNRRLEKALAELRSTQKQIIQQERLRALGEMASGIAHDFNNALMPIVGFSEILLSRPAVLADTTKASSYIEIIHTGATDAARIVARLREFYRVRDTTEVFTAVDAEKLIEQAIALTSPKWKDQAMANGAEIRVERDFSPSRLAIGNETELREALMNLIFNAVDAMPKGGELTLRTRDAGDAIEIEVADTGGGMTEEVRRRCLEPFFSTKGERGTGLGLAMVFGTLERHNGAIEIRSAPGCGATFVLRLPVHQGEVEVVGLGEREAKPRPLRILVVDDEPQVREVIAAFLTTDGHSVREAAHGQEGLNLMQSDDFDLVITDKAMPGMNGDQMARAIKAQFPRLPVILLSGFSDFLDAETIPCVEVVAPKPISMNGLRIAVEKARASVAELVSTES